MAVKVNDFDFLGPVYTVQTTNPGSTRVKTDPDSAD